MTEEEKEERRIAHNRMRLCYLWNLRENDAPMALVAGKFGFSYELTMACTYAYCRGSQSYTTDPDFDLSFTAQALAHATRPVIADRMQALQALADYEWSK
jgi:hypothetical protein